MATRIVEHGLPVRDWRTDLSAPRSPRPGVQDTGNLRTQQQGFGASARGTQALGTYPEVRFRRFQEAFDKYLAMETQPG